MNDQIPRHCTCGHKRKDHKYHEFETPEALLAYAVRQHEIKIEVIRHPDRMEPMGYTVDHTFYTHEQAVAVAKKTLDEQSNCRGCQCKNFKHDNLKYLEDLSEHTTGKIIH